MRKEILLGFALTSSSVLAACGSDTQDEEMIVPETVESSVSASDIEVTYFDDGSKKLTVPGQFSSSLTDAVIIQWCEGTDMMSNSQQVHSAPYRGGAAGGTEISVNHEACADGRLTPSDFEPLG